MNTKICTKCGLEKPISEFNNNRTKSDGKQSECKECHKLLCSKYYGQNKSRYRNNSKNKREAIRNYLNIIKSTGCALCDEKDVACLDFHHLRDKDYTIADLVRNENFSKIKEEITKCIVLCANCLRKVHYYDLNIEDERAST